eukprot:scaffold3036_cov414-Prasinococcus_capsulatus_cf.AAC.18
MMYRRLPCSEVRRWDSHMARGGCGPGPPWIWRGASSRATSPRRSPGLLRACWSAACCAGPSGPLARGGEPGTVWSVGNPSLGIPAWDACAGWAPPGGPAWELGLAPLGGVTALWGPTDTYMYLDISLGIPRRMPR